MKNSKYWCILIFCNFLIVSLTLIPLTVRAATPDVTMVSPTTICAGEDFTISGTEFNTPTDVDEVSVNGVRINDGDPEFVSKNSTTYIIKMPAGAVTAGAQNVYIKVYNTAGDETAQDSIQVMMTINGLPAVTAGSNSPVCAGSDLNLTESGGAAVSWSWSGPDSFTSMSQNPTISSVTTAADGSYTVTVTDGNGCEASDNVSVTVNAPVANAGSNSPVCVGEDIDLTESGGDAVSWSWTGPDGFTSMSQNPTISSVTTAADGIYSVTVTDGNGCEDTDNVTVTVNTLPTATAGGNSPVCEGEDLNLTESAGDAVSWDWSGPDGFTSMSQNPTVSSVTTAADGTYNVTITDGNGCQAADGVTISINAAPSVTIGSNSPICEGEDIDLTESGPDAVSWSWTGPDGFTSMMQDPTISSATTAADGIYSVTITDAIGCEATDNVNVTVNTLPAAVAGSNSPICEDEDINLTESGSDAVSWNWTGPNSFTSFSQNPTISGATAAAGGMYTVLITDGNGCQSGSNTAVTVNPRPTAAAILNALTSDVDICEGENITIGLSGAGAGQEYKVFTDASLTSPASPPTATGSTFVPNSSPNSDGSYWVQIFSTPEGCESTQPALEVPYTVHPAPAITLTSNPNPANICDGDNITFTESGGEGASWEFFIGTNSVQGPSATNTFNTATLSDGDQVKVIVTDAIGCSDESSAITVNIEDPAHIINVDIDASVCIDDGGFSIDLNADIDGGSINNNGIWTIVSGTGCFGANPPCTSTRSDNSTGTNLNNVDTEYWPTYTDVGNDTVTLKLSTKDQGVCATQIESITRKIAFLEQSAPTINVAGNEVCPESTFIVQGILADGGTTGTWSTVTPDPGSFATTPESDDLIKEYIPSVEDLVRGYVTIQLDQDAGLCPPPVPSEITIDFFNSPITGNIVGTEPIIDAVDSVCTGMKNVIYEIDGNPPDNYSFNWTLPTGLGTKVVGSNSGSIGINFSLEPADTIVHTLEAQAVDENGCVGNVSSLDIKTMPIPYVNIALDKTNFGLDEGLIPFDGTLVVPGQVDPIIITGDSVNNLTMSGPGIQYVASQKKYEFNPEAAGVTSGGQTHKIKVQYVDTNNGCVSDLVTRQVTVYDPFEKILNLEKEYCQFETADFGSPNMRLKNDLKPKPVGTRTTKTNYGYYSVYGGDLLWLENVESWDGFSGPGLVSDPDYPAYPNDSVRFDPSLAGGPGTKTIDYKITTRDYWYVRNYNTCYYIINVYNPCATTTQVCVLSDPLFGICLQYQTVCVPGYVPQCVGAYTGDTTILAGYENYFAPVQKVHVSQEVEVIGTPALPHIVDIADELSDDSLHYCATDELDPLIINNIDSAGIYKWYDVPSAGSELTQANPGNDFSIDPASLGIVKSGGIYPAQENTYYISKITYGNLISCESPTRRPVDLNIYAIPPPPAITQPDPYCQGENIEPLMATGSNINWYSDIGMASLASVPTFNTGLTSESILDTTFYVTQTINGCSNTAVPVDVIVNPKPSVAFAGLDSAYCIDYSQKVNLTGLPTDAGGVFTGNGIKNLGVGLAEFSVKAAADSANTPSKVSTHTIKYTYTDGNGCTDSIRSNVQINPLPVPDIKNITDAQEFCLDEGDKQLFGTSESLSPIASQVYSTYRKGVIGEFYSPDIVGIDSIDYQVEDQNGCTNIVSRWVKVNPLPIPSFELSSQCNQVDIEFTNNTTLSEGSITEWNWTFGDGSTSDTESPSHEYLFNEQYNVTLTANTNRGCENSFSKLVTIGQFPHLNFTWAGVCEGGVTQFDATAIEEGNIKNWNWDFDDASTAANLPDPMHEFSDPGEYSVSVTAETFQSCIETKTQRVVILPTYDLTSDYTEDFEQNSDSWIPGDVFSFGDSISWSWKPVSPDASYISGNENSGTTFWASAGNINAEDDNAYYFNREHSSINSPCFSLVNFEKPMISFDFYKDIEEGSDGVTFQYSDDGGASWKILGEENTGDNWFDNRGILGLTGFDASGNTNAWTGTSEEWVNAKYNLDLLQGKGQVRFRFALGTNEANFGSNPYKGFAFDNVFIGERNRTVLLEQFVNRNQSGSLAEENFADQMSASSDEVVTIKYHTAFPQNDRFSQDNPSDPSTRSLFYGVANVPRVYLDGESEDTEFSKGWGDRESDRRVLYRAPFNLTMSTPPTEDGSLQVNAVITALTSFDKPFNAFIAILEDEVDKNGVTTKNILRKVLPNATGRAFNRTWSAGEKETFSVVYNLKEVTNPDMDNVSIIFFIQNPEDHEIYQAASSRSSNEINKVTGLSENLSKIAGSKIYPNPANNYFELNFERGNNKFYDWYVIDQRGVKLDEGKIQPEQNKIYFDSRDYPAGVNHLILGNDAGDFYAFKIIVLH